jgi:nucleotide-binding universal stress UspA family protein
MESAPVPRPIASSAYSFVRFCGGAIAPFVAGKLAQHVSPQAPFFLAAVMTAIGILVLFVYRDALRPVADVPPSADALSATDLPTADRAPEPAAAPAAPGPVRPLLVAVAGSIAPQVSAMAVPLARARGGAVHVLHVLEEDIVAGEDAVELESGESARELLDRSVAELRASGMTVSGELVRAVGNHADVARRILRRAEALDAGVIVIGPETRHGLLLGPVVARVVEHAQAHVIVLHPAAGALGRTPAQQPAIAR